MPGLRGKRILVTAGSTRAYIDAVRYISNYSSGMLGSLIASECLCRKAEVCFFHGEGSLTPGTLVEQGKARFEPEDLERLKLVSIADIPHLVEIIQNELKTEQYDAVVHSMAVLDYVPDPVQVSKRKEKSDKSRWVIELVPTPKIIDLIKKISPATRLVGFKLEVGLTHQELLNSARKLMERSGADLIVANDLDDAKSPHYKAILLQRMGNADQVSTLDVQGRDNTASLICDRLERLLNP